MEHGSGSGRRSQLDKIRAYLEAGHSLTSREAQELFRCDRLGARIWDLRDAGLPIVRVMESRADEDGVIKRWARYSMKKAAPDGGASEAAGG